RHARRKVPDRAQAGPVLRADGSGAGCGSCLERRAGGGTGQLWRLCRPEGGAVSRRRLPGRGRGLGRRQMDFGIGIATSSDSWKLAQRAEELGFTHAWFFDTQMITGDCFVAMAAAALKTSRIDR